MIDWALERRAIESATADRLRLLADSLLEAGRELPDDDQARAQFWADWTDRHPGEEHPMAQSPCDRRNHPVVSALGLSAPARSNGGEVSAQSRFHARLAR